MAHFRQMGQGGGLKVVTICDTVLIICRACFQWRETMTLQEIKKIAKEKNVATDKNMKKADIIRAIQRQEGNSDCFGKSTSDKCAEINCLWRQDCLT